MLKNKKRKENFESTKFHTAPRFVYLSIIYENVRIASLE